MTKAKATALADKALGKIISKKLLVWILATVFLLMKIIDKDQWFLITMLWMGAVGVIDIAKQFMNKD